MAFTARDVLTRASTLLQDAGNTRWTLPELLGWLNDALAEIPNLAPEAVSEIAVIPMALGTMQTKPADAAQILRVNCNVTGNGPYTRGRVITPIKRQILDAQIPGWQATATLPFQSVVSHFVEDDAMNGEFLVAPGNDGTGKIEVVIAKRPTQIAVPANPLNIDSYTATVDLDEMFRPACVNYVMSQALLKDIGIPNGPQRAAGHYQSFLTAFGIRQAKESSVNPTSDDPARAARP